MLLTLKVLVDWTKDNLQRPFHEHIWRQRISVNIENINVIKV